jgi:enoyl-CoA hydratase
MVITMDDGKANAMSIPMQAGIKNALDEAEKEEAPVVLVGRPGLFSAGFDLKTLAASGQPAVDMLRGGLDLSLRLLEFPTPVIAACSGHAIAMGIFVLTSCDYRIGVQGNYRYSANEVAIGMTMPWSTIEILRQRLSPTAVSRAVLFAENFTPDNAIPMGILDEVVAEEELMSRAVTFAQQTLSLNMTAHAHSKKRLRAETIASIRAGLDKDMAGWQKQFLA